MKPIIPKKLLKGDTVRIIAPGLSMKIISEETHSFAKKKFEALGLHITFGEHNEEIDELTSTSIASRIEDLHDAFLDKNVTGIMTVIGGFNSNQLLDYIDWNILKENPKVFCGFSDITALNNAIFAKTGLVTYSSPHYSTFGQKLYFNYTLNYFKKCLMGDTPFEISPSSQWTDDEWYLDQNNRNPVTNKGYWVINEGNAQGTIVGANLCTFNLLQGTQYFPSLENTLLFLEDDAATKPGPATFDRDLQSLIHQPGFCGVQGLVIGRFQKASKVEQPLLRQILKSKKELNKIPVIANVDFGHTDPKITFPIGGVGQINTEVNKQTIKILKH